MQLEPEIPTIISTSESLGNVAPLETSSYQSSTLSSCRTARLAALFPNKRKAGKFKPNSKILQFLREGCNASIEFLARLENVGYTSAATLVNRFGASDTSIANTFALMGPHYILDEDHQGTCLQLVIFARTQFLRETTSKGRFIPVFDDTSEEWQIHKKDHTFSQHFEQMGEYEYENLFDDVGNADFIEEAQTLLQGTRQQIRAWIRTVDKTKLPSLSGTKTNENGGYTTPIKKEDSPNEPESYWV